MKNGKVITLTSYDDLLSVESSIERVQEIALSDLHSFKKHPFKVLDDERMQETVESIQKYGVLVPALARPRAEGGYDLLAGHRRRRASELAELDTMPVLVRDLTDDEAVIVMVDSNLQRENLLPSEKAWAYRMKLEAIKHQGATCGQVGQKSRDEIAKNAPDCGRQIQRYIKLTDLLPELLDMVDSEAITFGVGVTLSSLRQGEQEVLLATIKQMEDIIIKLLEKWKIDKAL